MQPHRRQPTRLHHPWDSPCKNTGVACHFLQCMKVKSESEVAQSCPTLSNPMDCSHQAPPSIGFSRQEYWSGVPLPSPSLGLLNLNSLSMFFLLDYITAIKNMYMTLAPIETQVCHHHGFVSLCCILFLFHFV